jgi:predicted HTH transcriptional regulator
MLLGRDEVIKSVAPAYRTDALLRKVNTDRYDDRLIVEINLIDSYDLLMGFAAKHLWDKFYLEGDTRVSLSSAIAREMLVNCLMHREFSSSYIAQFVIEKDRMFTANANRARDGQYDNNAGQFQAQSQKPDHRIVFSQHLVGRRTWFWRAESVSLWQTVFRQRAGND